LAGTLAEAYPWLVDAKVLSAWSLLSQRRTHANDPARAALLDAANRGLPAYSAGLRLLYNGLRLFMRDGDEEVAQAVRIVRAVASAADWSHPLTTFTGEHPKAPSPKPIETRLPEGPNWMVVPAI
jgi:hypothetical protein